YSSPTHRTTFLIYTPPAPPHISTLSLHDALPISASQKACTVSGEYGISSFMTSSGVSEPVFSLRTQSMVWMRSTSSSEAGPGVRDRKSTRLNSSHVSISYAVFCLKKKNTNEQSIH